MRLPSVYFWTAKVSWERTDRCSRRTGEKETLEPLHQLEEGEADGLQQGVERIFAPRSQMSAAFAGVVLPGVADDRFE